MGRLQDRYSLNNFVYFTEQLNRHLYELIASRKRLFSDRLRPNSLLILERNISLTISFLSTNHASTLKGLAAAGDEQKLEPTGNLTTIYTPKVGKIVRAVVAEAEANTRTIEQIDSVKLVIFDLDDTLWRGVAAEQDNVEAWRMIEGWPISILEAVSFLWRRGILIAIVSKNDEKTALATWNRLYGNCFEISNFVATRINGKPKAENVREILEQVNLLPSSVLFVDDNPVERAAVKAAFPEMRVMDAALAHWRRILLWSPQLQRSVITAESAQRTEMIQAQIEREGAASRWIAKHSFQSLSVVLRPFQVTATDEARFARCSSY